MLPPPDAKRAAHNDDGSSEQVDSLTKFVTTGGVKIERTSSKIDGQARDFFVVSLHLGVASHSNLA